MRAAAHRRAAHCAVPPRVRRSPPCTGGPWARLPSRRRPSSAARVGCAVCRGAACRGRLEGSDGRTGRGHGRALWARRRSSSHWL
eukprot:scaffold70432_cov61-Phaeocystis_antarctica.AAC.2